MRVQETDTATLPCPCGCAAMCEQHDGILHFEQGGGYFRALLMRDPDGAPAIWLSLTTNGPAEDPRSWLVTLHGDRHGASIADPEASPVVFPPSESLRVLRREELLAFDGVPEFYFACFDALMAQHSRLQPFLRT